MIGFEELYNIAQELAVPRKLSEYTDVAMVGAALLTDKGNVYKGVCIDAPCGMGFCAEHSAIAAMVTAGENRIVKVIAVGADGRIMAPCGRCREFMAQIHDDNRNAEVMLARDNILLLKDILPYDWRK